LKALALACAILFCSFPSSAAPAARAGVRSFASGTDQLKVSGYAEVLYGVKKSSPPKHEFLSRTRIWFDGKERYRIELLDTVRHRPSPMAVIVHLGNHIYMSSLIHRGFQGQEDWWGGPESCMPGLLKTYLMPGAEMRNARLLGVERVLDLRAEHWRGLNLRGTTFDVYNSIDPRFPLVLARESGLQGWLSTWRITKLEIGPVPAYVFSTQVHPRGGVWPMLSQPFRPFPVTLALHVALLCCYIGFVLLLARGGSSRCLVLSVLVGCVILLDLCMPRVPTDYWYQWSDVPRMLLLSLLTCAGMALMWRATGSPGKIAFTGRIGWKALICALALGSFNLVTQYAQHRQMTHSLGAANWTLPFLPVLLLNVMIYVIPDVGMQELVFRGYIYAALEKRFQSPAKVIAIQALLFGVYHLPKDLSQILKHNGSLLWLLDAPTMVLFGVLFGVLRWKSRGLAAPWLVHAAYNTAFFYVGSASMLGLLRGLSL
jgi:membrane protease YdiL (CAAX protease family)